MYRKIIAIGVTALALFHLSLGSALAQEEVTSSIEVTPSNYDFGDIYVDEGVVSTTVTVKNTGVEKIAINRLSTSCGCTTAEMDLSDIKPGESREMIIFYDPSVHPDIIGPITRVVYLQTSDPVRPEIEIEFVGNSVGPAKNKIMGELDSQIEGEKEDEDIEPTLESKKVVTVFFNESCQDCGELVNDFYPNFFEEYGYTLDKKDYINQRENRTLLNEYNLQKGIPFELQSHLAAFVGEDLLIGGHVPESIIRYLLENPDKYNKLLVYQDKMHDKGTEYTVWDFKGEPKTYPLDEPITTYLESGSVSESTSILRSASSFWGLFAVITSSAFLDGMNPCAIAVLLFFIAFLFSIKKTKGSIWKIGAVYIFGIYLAYFLIGIGLAQVILITGYPHLMAYVGAYLVIGLGIVQLVGVAFPQFPIRLRIPINTKAVVEKWLYKGTIPAALIGGFIVGLCTFPCSGGIYVAIIGMLASSQTYWQGFSWMIWYNLIFVAPLIIFLLLATNPKTTEQLQKWERKESIHAKVLIGVTMIALGVIIIVFFT